MILSQLREEASALSEADLAYIDVIKGAAIQYAKTATGINGVDEPDNNGRKLDDYPDITMAVLVIISDMYDNRQFTVDKKDVNRVVDNIFSRYAFNLVPGAEE